MRSSTVVSLAAFALFASACDKAVSIEAFNFPVAASDSSSDPALVVDPATGDVIASWMVAANGKWTIQVARSKDQGSTWSTPASVTASDESIVPHAESAPRLIVTPRGVVAVAWSDSKEMPGRQWPASNIRFARSVDGGSTWSKAITLNDDSLAGPSGHLFHGAIAAGDSSIVVAWLDSRVVDSVARHTAATKLNVGNAEHAEHGVHSDAEPDAHVMFAQSDNQGETWSTKNAILSPSACPCCRITLAKTPNGSAVFGAWRMHMGANVRDIVIARVWPNTTPPSRVHNDDWIFPGCPHTGPGISVGEDGSAHVSWFTGVSDKAGIYYAASTPDGKFAAPIALSVGKNHPVTHSSVATAANGLSLVAWEDTASVDRSVALALIGNAPKVEWSTIVAGSAGADHPQVIALPDGQFVVAWAMRTAAGPRIAAVRIKR